jgi:hypothetical protein
MVLWTAFAETGIQGKFPHSEKQTYQELGTSKNLKVCKCLAGLYSANSKLAGAMPILPGRLLGSYEILSAIGAGKDSVSAGTNLNWPRKHGDSFGRL